jgi:RNA polymerase sigma-70 factor (ECF subfamily)
MPVHAHREPLADEQLLGNINHGCQECFGLLFRRHFRSVLGIAFKILRDQTEAEDILQEVFLAIHLQQERFDPAKGTVRTWILQFRRLDFLAEHLHLATDSQGFVFPNNDVGKRAK